MLYDYYGHIVVEVKYKGKELFVQLKHESGRDLGQLESIDI